MVSKGTIKFGLLMLVIFYFGFRLTFELFDYIYGGFKRDILIIFMLFVASHYLSKKSKKEQTEEERAEQSILENGIINYHAKEIIQNYGHAAFVNKQQKEIEDIVNEYIDLFGIDTTEFTVFDVVNEINREINKK